MSADPQHPIDVTRGADRRAQATNAHERREIAARMKPTKRRKNILSALATGFLPWGVDWRDEPGHACLPWCGGQYILCCGHTLRRGEAQAFVDAGLLMAGDPASERHKRPNLVITPAGRTWLAAVW